MLLLVHFARVVVAFRWFSSEIIKNCIEVNQVLGMVRFYAAQHYNVEKLYAILLFLDIFNNQMELGDSEVHKLYKMRTHLAKKKKQTHSFKSAT